MPARAISLTRTRTQTLARANDLTTPIRRTPALDEIDALGRILDDLESTRIQTTNRIGALEREKGEALPHLYFLVEPIAASEHQAELELNRAWRKHPLAKWQNGYRGAGEKSVARLLSIIGEPAARPNVAKLWAYCGVGRPGRIPKGATQAEVFACGNPRAKKQVWLIACSIVKTGVRTNDETGEKYAISPGGETYLARRSATAERVHDKDCPQCRAKAGDPWRDGHKHADALRVVAKTFLKDIWIAARQDANDTQPRVAGR